MINLFVPTIYLDRNVIDSEFYLSSKKSISFNNSHIENKISESNVRKTYTLDCFRNILKISAKISIAL